MTMLIEVCFYRVWIFSIVTCFREVITSYTSFATYIHHANSNVEESIVVS